MKKLIELFWSFMQIGGLTFGGGYAMLPMLQKEVVEHKKWATEDELMNYFAIGQCTPGVIAINTATFVGHKVAGVAGGIVATLGVVFPCWVIITIISLFIRNFSSYAVVQHALAGISCCVFALVLDATIKLGKKSVKGVFGVVMCLLIFCLAMFTDISSFYLVIGAGLCGWLIYPHLGENLKGGAN